MQKQLITKKKNIARL